MMKQIVKNKIKAIISVICAFVLLFNMAGSLPFVQGNADEVQAAGNSTQSVDLNSLTEITWSDFKVTEGGDIGWNKMLYSKDTINDTIFNGNIVLSQDGSGNADFRYGSNWVGIILQLTEQGNLYLTSDSFDFSNPDVSREYKPSEFGANTDLAANGTFKGVNFNLKIAITDMTDDGTVAKVGIWINNIMLGGEFFIMSLKAEKNDVKFENTLLKNAGVVHAYKKSLDLPTPFPTYMQEISWDDFNVGYGNAQFLMDVRADINPIDAETNNLILYVFNHETTGSLGDVENLSHKEFEITAKNTNYQTVAIDLEWLLNEKGEFPGFSFAAFGGDSSQQSGYDIYIQNLRIQNGNNVENILLSTDNVVLKDGNSTGLTGGNGGYIGVSGTGLYIWKALLYRTHKVSFNTPLTFAKVATTNYEEKEYSDIRNTIFNADIVFLDTVSEFRYSAAWGGLTFQVNENGLGIRSEYFNQEPDSILKHTYTAAEFGLEKWEGTRFNLKIAVKDVANDGLSYMAAVWINNRLLGDKYITLTSSHKDGVFNSKMVYKNLAVYSASLGMPIMDAQSLQPTKINWKSFGLTKGMKYTTKWQTGTCSLPNLDNTVFEDYIIFSEGAGIRYGGSDGSFGLHIYVGTDNALHFHSDTFSLTDLENNTFSPEAYGLTAFAGEMLKLKITMNDVTATTAKVGVWVNDKALDEEFTMTSKNPDYKLGNKVCILDGSKDLAADGYVELPNYVPVPTDLTSITWEDFGIVCVETWGSEFAEKSLIGVDSLNNTLFNGDVIMGKGSTIRYAGSNGNFGLHINITSEDKLSFSSDTFNCVGTGEYEASQFGLDTFENKKFNLKIAVTNLTSTGATFGVWINDQIAGDYFALDGIRSGAEEWNPQMGTCLSFWKGGSITPYSVVAKPTLTKVSLEDWKADVKDDHILSPYEIPDGTQTDKVTTLVNTSFEETFLFSGPSDDGNGNYLFAYGGLNDETNGWFGLRIIFRNDQMLLQVEGAGSMPQYALNAETAGVSFVGEEYDWKIDTVDYKGHVLIYMYFNGQLYGNGPVMFPNYSSHMGNRLMNYFFPSGEKDGVTAYIGGTDKELAPYYHNLDEGEYTLPSGLAGIQKRISEAEEGWMDMEVENVQKLSEVGDYKINYNDGVSVYSTEVLIYRPGLVDHSAKNRTAAQLVRVLKAVANGATPQTTFKCETKAYDVNLDGAFDTQTDTSVNVDTVAMRYLMVGKTDDSAVMPIVGYRGPGTEQTSDDVYKLIRELGINQIIQYENGFGDNAPSRYSVYQQLSLASKYNLQMTVKDERLLANPTGYNKDSLAETMKDYSGYQSFNGLYIIDEPGDKVNYPTVSTTACFLDDDVQKLAALVNSENIFASGNLIPYKYGYVGNKTAQYKYVQYLRRYVDLFGAKFISYTRYPFWNDASQQDSGEDGTVQKMKGYFTNLALARHVAKEKNIPFRSFVQAGEGFENASTLLGDAGYPNPSEGEFKWNANTALAFGAKGIQYFTLVQLDSHVDYADGTPASGLIDKNGKKTCWYDYAVDVNKQVAAIDEVLMNAESAGIMATGGYAKNNAYNTVDAIELYEKSGWSTSSKGTVSATVSDSAYAGASVASTDNTYGALTGCFEVTGGKYKGKHAMYVVNFNPEDNNTVVINLGESKTATTILNGETTVETAFSLTRTLGAGEAVLVVY